VRREIRYHTDEQIEASIGFGLAIVENLVPPDDLREAVFTQACSMHSAKHIMEEVAQPMPLNMIVPRGGP
jgi:hypothetical protein